MSKVAAPRSRIGIRAFVLFVLASVVGNYVAVRQPSLADAGSYFELVMMAQVFLLWPLLFLLLVYPVTRKARHLMIPIAIGVLCTSRILPADWKHYWRYVETLRWVVVGGFLVAEVWVMALLLRSLTRLRGTDAPEDMIREIVTRYLGDSVASRLMATELLMWFFSLASWRSRGYRYAGKEFFTTHEHDHNISTQRAFLILIGAEMPIMHGLLWLWSPTAAWIVTAISVYGYFWLLGEYRASLLRPVSIDDEFLYLRYGLLGNEKVPLQAIASVRSFNQPMRRQRGLLRHTPAMRPNLRIQLHGPTEIKHMFGTSTYETIVLGVDEPARLMSALNDRIHG